MSTKLSFKNIKAVRTGKKARISNACCARRDEAVEAMQEAGADLGHFFSSLKDPIIASKLVRAIRCKNRKGVEVLLGPDCNVVCFFNHGDYSCVRISCVFGECCNVRISFDICVSGGPCRNLGNTTSNSNFNNR